MRSLKPILKTVFMALHVLFMYVIPALFFAIPMALDVPLPFARAGLQSGDKAQILVVILSTLFIGLLFYVAYLKVKASESINRKGSPNREK